MAAVIIEEQGSMINYEIPKASINKLSQAFRLLEANKESLGIVDYALSQSTLEQVTHTIYRLFNSNKRLYYLTATSNLLSYLYTITIVPIG